jgi:DNA-binding winged helix-turn-helix (wHTH) protein
MAATPHPRRGRLVGASSQGLATGSARLLYRFDDYILDTEHYELRQAGRLVRLAPRVFNLVAYLVQQPGRLVTNEELKERLWPQHAVVGEASLANAVAQARRALGDTGQVQRYIQTVHRRGYRFVGAVTAQPAGAADLPRAPAPAAPPPVTSLLDQANTVPPPPVGPSAPPTAAPSVILPLSRSKVTTSDAPSAAAIGTPEDEWRPLTALACQLVGVFEPTSPLGREARLAVVREYHTMCIEVMQRFESHLAQSQGDRLLVYFGYPQAHEDDARRAVLMGLAMVEELIELNR